MKLVRADETPCPKYKTCRTGRVLSSEFCTRYKCNTFYQIDTIDICNRINDYLANRSINRNENSSISCILSINGHRVKKDIARIVQEAIQKDLKN